MVQKRKNLSGFVVIARVFRICVELEIGIILQLTK